MPQQVSTNTFGVAKWVVSANPTQGTHTTIQGAINSSVSGDTVWVRDGTYTEDLTLIPGITISAAEGSASTPSVIIVGTVSFTGTGTAVLADVRVQTNSSFCISVTGANASIINMKRCNLQATNSTAIQFSSSNSAASIILDFCSGNITTTGIAMFAHSSAGTLLMRYCVWNNSGASTTASTASAGILSVYYSQLLSPVTTSGTNIITGNYNLFNTATQNVTSLTIGGSGANSLISCVVLSGTASAVSISSTLVFLHQQ